MTNNASLSIISAFFSSQLDIVIISLDARKTGEEIFDFPDSFLLFSFPDLEHGTGPDE